MTTLFKQESPILSVAKRAGTARGSTKEDVAVDVEIVLTSALMVDTEQPAG